MVLGVQFSGTDRASSDREHGDGGDLLRVWPPVYIKDTISQNPRSGFLQFWTVSAHLRMDEAIDEKGQRGVGDGFTHCELFGRRGTVIGKINVDLD